MKDFLNRMNQVEPARVRAVWVALVALLASAGYAVGSDVDAAVGAAIVLVFTVLPIIQGEATRNVVYAPATVAEIEGEIPLDEMNDGDPIDEGDYPLEEELPAVPAPPQLNDQNVEPTDA